MKDIKNFHIGTAYYIIENDKDSKLRIDMDYTTNSFATKVLKKGGNLDKLKKQSGIIAKDMLGRKAQRNLNYKLLQLQLKV